MKRKKKLAVKRRLTARPLVCAVEAGESKNASKMVMKAMGCAGEEIVAGEEVVSKECLRKTVGNFGPGFVLRDGEAIVTCGRAQEAFEAEECVASRDAVIVAASVEEATSISKFSLLAVKAMVCGASATTSKAGVLPEDDKRLCNAKAREEATGTIGAGGVALGVGEGLLRGEAAALVCKEATSFSGGRMLLRMLAKAQVGGRAAKARFDEMSALGNVVGSSVMARGAGLTASTCECLGMLLSWGSEAISEVASMIDDAEAFAWMVLGEGPQGGARKFCNPWQLWTSVQPEAEDATTALRTMRLGLPRGGSDTQVALLQGVPRLGEAGWRGQARSTRCAQDGDVKTGDLSESLTTAFGNLSRARVAAVLVATSLFIQTSLFGSGTMWVRSNSLPVRMRRATADRACAAEGNKA